MAQLAQAYIHFRPYSASEKEFRALGKYAERLARDVAGAVYGGDVVVRIEIENGSLRTRMTVIGSLMLATYGGVANIKGFQEGVGILCDGAREFAIDVCTPFAEKAGVAVNQIYRFERRTKTPGKIQRITKRLDKLQRSISELSPKDVQAELGDLKHQLEGVAEDLSSEELKEVQKNLKRKGLPPPSKWPPASPIRAVIHREEKSSPTLSPVRRWSASARRTKSMQRTPKPPPRRFTPPARNISISQASPANWSRACALPAFPISEEQSEMLLDGSIEDHTPTKRLVFRSVVKVPKSLRLPRRVEEVQSLALIAKDRADQP